MNWNRALVIGASSGIGRALAERLVTSGAKVAVVARRFDALEDFKARHTERIFPYQHDVCHVEEVPELFARICHDLGGLDLVIYASGVMPEVGPSEFNFEKDDQVLAVNVRGAVAWLNEAATRFRGSKQGTIVGIGSVAGDRGRVGQPVYNASKAFLATYLEALRNRLSRFGVNVVTIKPGPVRTEMTARLHLNKAMPVEQAADIILKKMARPGEHYLRASHAVAFWVIKRIPSQIFRRLKI